MRTPPHDFSKLIRCARAIQSQTSVKSATGTCVCGSLGVISTFWLLIGGIIDLRALFRDLAARSDNPLDNGRVEGHVSLVDKAAFEARTGQNQDD